MQPSFFCAKSGIVFVSAAPLFMISSRGAKRPSSLSTWLRLSPSNAATQNSPVEISQNAAAHLPDS